MEAGSRKRVSDYLIVLVSAAAFLSLVLGLVFNQIQALLSVASLLLALRLYFTTRDGNVRRVLGVLSVYFGASFVSNTAWYLLPGVLRYDFLHSSGYYYLSGMFWLIGYAAIAFELLRLKNSKQWYIHRSLDRSVTAIGLLGLLLLLIYTLINSPWNNVHCLDIIILFAYLSLDLLILATAYKLAQMKLPWELRYLVLAILTFFAVNSIGDLLYETRFLYHMKYLLSLALGGHGLIIATGDATDIIYNLSLLSITGLLFLYSPISFLSPLRDDIRKLLSDTQLLVDNLLAKSPDAMCIFDRDGSLALANDSFLELFGLRRKDLDRSFNVFSHLGHILGSQAAGVPVARVREGGTIIVPRLEVNALHGRRGSFHIFLKMFPTCGSDGSITNYVLIIEDITGQVEAEIALKISEERYRLVAEGAQDLIFVVGRDLRVQYVNHASAEALGVDAGAVTGKPLEGMFPEDEYRRMKITLLEIIASQKPQSTEIKQTFRAGDRMMHVLLSPLIDQAGQVSGVMGISRDITERKRAEAALRESEAKFRAIFEQAAVGISLADLDGRIMSANQAYCDIVGRVPGELIGRTIESITCPDDWGANRELNGRLLRGERTTDTMEKRYVRGDGQLVWAKLAVSMVPGPDGGPGNYISVIEDITERVSLENKLFEAYNSLKEEYERKTDFTNAAAHELRTPLTPIIGYTDILKSEVRDDRHRKFLEIIERNALRQKNLVNSMLELASLDAGTTQVSCADLAVRPLAEEVADNYRPINPGIRVDVPEGLRVRTDADILRHVLDNLVSNAVKYSDPGAGIEIRAADEGDRCLFSVRDGGPGIPKEEWGRIFERFYIVGGDQDNRSGGRIGLGLALVRAYVSLLGGTVWLDSEQGKGSTFYFTVPKQPPG